MSLRFPKKIRIFSTEFDKSLQHRILRIYFQRKSSWKREVTDGRTSMTMLKDAFRYYAKMPKIVKGWDFSLLKFGNIKADLDEITWNFSIQLQH